MTPLWFAVLFAALTVIASWRPVWAIGLLVVGLPTYLLRTSIAGIPTTALEAAVLGTLVGYALRNTVTMLQGRNVIREHWEVFRSTVPRSLTIFLILTIVGWLIASWLSIDVRASFGSLKAWLIEPLLIGLIILEEARSDRSRKWLELSLLIALLWVSLAGLVQLIGFQGTVEDGRLSSVFTPVANYFTMFAAPLVVYAAGLFLANRLRVLAGLSAVIGIVCLVLAYSYGALLGVVAGLVVLALTFLPPLQRKRALWIMTGLVILFVIIQLPSRHFHEKLNFTTRSSSLVRTEIWRTAIEIGKQHPIVGIGPGTFEKAYREVAPTLYHPPLEWLVAKPHNLYLNLWVETGLLGLVGILGAYFIFLRRTLRQRSFSAIAAASSIAILVHGLLDTPLFKNDLAVLAIVIAALGLVSAVAETKN